MGHMDVIAIVANGINIYLPILIMLLCLATWFRVFERFLHALGIDQFIGYDHMTQEMCNGGRALVAMERNRRARGTTDTPVTDRERARDELKAKYADRQGGRRGFGRELRCGSVAVRRCCCHPPQSTRRRD